MNRDADRINLSDDAQWTQDGVVGGASSAGSRIVPGIVLEGQHYQSCSDQNQETSDRSVARHLIAGTDALSKSAISAYDIEKENTTRTTIDGDEQSENYRDGGIDNRCSRFSSARYARTARSTDFDHDSEAAALGTYCSPRLNRRQRSGSYPVRDNRYPTRELSSLRADGYLKAKNNSVRARMSSGESKDSEELLDDVSHLSTCATSDYAFMTSMDTLDICHSCKATQFDQTQPMSTFKKRPVSLEVDNYSNLRRTHSNPESCISEAEDSAKCGLCGGLDKSCPHDPDVPQYSQNTLKVDNRHAKLKATISDSSDKKALHERRKSQALEEYMCTKGRHGAKPVATSEENLVSRVSRWLSTMEQPECRDPDTF